jgi:hypothetical protein
LNACERLSRYCFNCLDGIERRRAGIFLAESIILNAQTQTRELNNTEKLLEQLNTQTGREDIDLLRCRARLYAAQQKFDEAAEIWKKIADVKKLQAAQTDIESWQWWRAKYHQLYCLSKTANADAEKLTHTIDVLLNSYNNIPAPWDKKLHKLMENLKK